MSREQEHNTEPVTGKHQLIEYLAAGCKDPHDRGVGTEHEKFGVFSDTLEPIPYEGERGIGVILQAMADKFGWEPDFDRGKIMALVRDGAAISLEPGGQLELSGKVTKSVFGTAEELTVHLEELGEISAPLGHWWLGAGCHPTADLEHIPWMPKSRYALMAPFLGSHGELAHYMMKATSTIQANFDFTSEADLADILHVGTRISPIISAIFANAPLLGGRDTGYQSYRCHIWTATDPARSGTPDFMLAGSSTYEQYVDYILDIPVMFLRRDDGYVSADGKTFRQLMDGGFCGAPVSMGDWELHLSTCFPDLRVKQYVEVRGADGGVLSGVLALPALWKGILYDEQARGETNAFLGPMSPEEHQTLYNDVCRDGLMASFRGDRVLDWARRLVRISGEGLDRQAITHPSERLFLTSIEHRLRAARTPATEMLDLWHASDENPYVLAEYLNMAPAVTPLA